PPTRRATRRRANRTIECGNFDFHGRWCAKPRTIAESTDDPITPVDPTPGPAESGNRPYYSDHAFRVAAGVASHGNRERCLSTRLHASIDALGRRKDSTRPMQVRASPAAGSIRPSKAPGAR